MAWKATGEEWDKFQKDLKKRGVNVKTSAPTPAFVPAAPTTTRKKAPVNTKPATKRGGIMGIIDNVKKAFDPKERERKERAQYREESKQIHKRNKYLPKIQHIASKFGASVDALDTEAYVYKTEGKRTVGLHIPYGTPANVVYHRISVKFTKSAKTSHIIKGITNAAHRAKEIREELSEAGTAVKGAMGNGKGSMYDDPNFGGAFAAQPARSSSGGKKKKSQSNKDQLYPDIQW